MSFCPYHGNSDTPAFATSKTMGISSCFNPSCEEVASLEKLVRDIKGLNHFQAKRFIMSRSNPDVTFESKFDAIKLKTDKLEEFPIDVLKSCYRSLWSEGGAVAREYLFGRGFTEETLRYFKVGYSAKQDMIIVPMFDGKEMPIGLIGRSIVGKSFKNSRGLPKNRTPWNLHNAKRHEAVIIVESSFDAMRVHQAGYPNVIALLGGSLSADQEHLIKRYFNKVIIMTDNDAPAYYTNCRKCGRVGLDLCGGHQPGRVLGASIAEKLRGIRISWATYSDTEIYPRDVKDATDMIDDEIRQCLRNAISNSDYMAWQVA